MPFSENPTVLVVGSESLNDSYLCVRLELDGFNVDYMEFDDFVETASEKLKNCFSLINFQCKKRDVILDGLDIFAQVQDTATTRYALFNVHPEHICQKRMIGLIRQGLTGLFFDCENLEMVCRGVRIIMEGDIWLPRKLMMEIILADRVSSLKETAESESGQGTIEILTIREKYVLAKLASGLSNQEVAEQLFISIPTVKSHAKNIYKKIGVSSRLQAALWLAKNG